ncbi:MAG: hypothetical protein IJ264_06635 [Clostridia bacterium]|nr:hypothetical protein [Clostridia bacterium]
MKTAFRKILCAALALIMAFASVPAFAAEIGDNVKWVFYDPDDKIYLRDFYYAGTVQEGKNKLVYNVGDTGRQYYEFEAEKTGYYLLSTPGVAAYFGQPDSEGKINRIDTPWEYIESNDNCTEYTLIYLTKDVYTVGIEFWDTTKEENLTIEFLSSEIVDLEYNQSDFDSRIINDDIYITEFKNGFTYNIYSEHTNITFSGGKKLVDYSVYLTFTANEN